MQRGICSLEVGVREAPRLAWTLGLGPMVPQGAARTTGQEAAWTPGCIASVSRVTRVRSGEGRRIASGPESRRVKHWYQQLGGETVSVLYHRDYMCLRAAKF